MDLFVRCDRETHRLHATPDDTVFDLKCRIFSLTGVPPASMRLVLAGINLDLGDEQEMKSSLGSLHVKSDARILAIKK